MNNIDRPSMIINEANLEPAFFKPPLLGEVWRGLNINPE